MKEYKTTIGWLNWDFDAYDVESWDDPISPEGEGWILESSIVGALRQSRQPILWFWSRETRKSTLPQLHIIHNRSRSREVNWKLKLKQETAGISQEVANVLYVCGIPEADDLGIKPTAYPLNLEKLKLHLRDDEEMKLSKAALRLLKKAGVLK